MAAKRRRSDGGNLSGGGRVCRTAVTRVLLGIALLLGSAAVALAAEPAQLARGKYIFGATGGCGCHTEPKGVANAGGRKYDGPFGTVYSTNITPDTKTGIGSWTDEQIITAIRLGRRPNGERILPVHPFTSFNGMAEEDLQALVAFLRSVPPVNRPNTPKKITMPMFESVFLPAWLMTFASRETPPPAAPVSGVARGEYLVRAVGHCGECHTPRSAMTMAVDNGHFLAGNPKKTGPEGRRRPISRRTRGRAWAIGRRSRLRRISGRATGPMATSPAASWARRSRGPWRATRT